MIGKMKGNLLAFLCLLLSSPTTAARDTSIVLEAVETDQIYGPVSRFSIEGNPLPLMIGSMLAGKDKVIPVSFVETRLRLLGFLGVEFSPVLILGSEGGYGYWIGPTLYPNKYLQLNWQVSLLFLNATFNDVGSENGGIVRFTKEKKWKYLQWGLGGALGIVPATIGLDEEGEKEIKMGYLIGLIAEIGFSYPRGP